MGMDSKRSSLVSSKWDWTVFKAAHLHADFENLPLLTFQQETFSYNEEGTLARSTLLMKTEKSL